MGKDALLKIDECALFSPLLLEVSQNICIFVLEKFQ